MFGIIMPTRECSNWKIYVSLVVYQIIMLSFSHCLIKLLSHQTFRMSVEMVACIAIEALSILEKVHSRG